MGFCNWGYGGGYGYCSYGGYSNYGGGFALIVVLFVLLVIVGCTCFKYKKARICKEFSRFVLFIWSKTLVL